MRNAFVESQYFTHDIISSMYEMSRPRINEMRVRYRITNKNQR